jgi:hypothetical protein
MRRPPAATGAYLVHPAEEGKAGVNQPMRRSLSSTFSAAKRGALADTRSRTAKLGKARRPRALVSSPFCHEGRQRRPNAHRHQSGIWKLMRRCLRLKWLLLAVRGHDRAALVRSDTGFESRDQSQNARAMKHSPSRASVNSIAARARGAFEALINHGALGNIAPLPRHEKSRR